MKRVLSADFKLPRWVVNYHRALAIAAVLTLSGFQVTTPEHGDVDAIISRLYSNAPATAKPLIATTADINGKSSAGLTILIVAASVPDLKDLTIYEAILSRKPKLDEQDPSGMTALHYAAGQGKLELMDLLLKQGANPNTSSVAGSPLVAAVQNRQRSAAQRLLQVPDIQVDLADPYGRTALMFATMHADATFVRSLLQHGAQPNIYEILTGNTPLLWSASWSPDVASALLENRADARLVNPFTCQNAVHVAVSAQRLDVLRLLLERGVRADLGDFQGRTPLALARGNKDIAEVLTRALQGKGMNVTETAPTPPHCDDPNLTTYARQEPSRQQGPPVVDFVSLATDVIARWSKQQNVFLNSDLPQTVGYQIGLFRSIMCYTGNEAAIVKSCEQLMANRPAVRALIEEDLRETFIQKKQPITVLAARLSNAIGVDWRRSGYSTIAPNMMSCAHLAADYRSSTAVLIDGTGAHEISPGQALCLRAGSYEVVVASKQVELTLEFRPGLESPKTTTARLGSSSDVYGSEIIPPIERLCTPGPRSLTPLTQVIPLRDSVLIETPKAFSTAASATLAVQDPAGLCNAKCRLAIRTALVQSIALWKIGCSRCSFSNLLLISFDGMTYVNSRMLQDIESMVAAKHPLPTRTERRPLGNPGASFAYARLDRSSERMAALCKTSLPEPYAQLCGGTRSASDTINLVLELSNSSEACGTTTAIACATPDGVVKLRTFDHAFLVSSGTAVEKEKVNTTIHPIVFGHGAQQFDLLTVLLHELGHFFGLPHLPDGGSRDVMSRTYRDVRRCISSDDYSMLNQSIDTRWAFRLNGCAGLHF